MLHILLLLFLCVNVYGGYIICSDGEFLHDWSCKKCNKYYGKGCADCSALTNIFKTSGCTKCKDSTYVFHMNGDDIHCICLFIN